MASKASTMVITINPDGSKTCSVGGGDFESQYRRSEQILDAKYHRHPTKLYHIPESPEERVTRNGYEAMADRIVANAPVSSTPIGKTVL